MVCGFERENIIIQCSIKHDVILLAWWPSHIDLFDETAMTQCLALEFSLCHDHAQPFDLTCLSPFNTGRSPLPHQVLAQVAQSMREHDSTELEIVPLLESLRFVLVLEVNFPLEQQRAFFVEAVNERSRSYYLGLRT